MSILKANADGGLAAKVAVTVVDTGNMEVLDEDCGAVTGIFKP